MSVGVVVAKLPVQDGGVLQHPRDTLHFVELGRDDVWREGMLGQVEELLSFKLIGGVGEHVDGTEKEFLEGDELGVGEGV